MSALTLEEFLDSHTSADPARAAVPAVVAELARAGRAVWRLAQDPEAQAFDTVETGTNPDGDTQIKLDLVADRIFLEAASRAPVAAYASEERAEPHAIDSGAPLALSVDPLDGSSNVDLNLSFGTIFSILPAICSSPAKRGRGTGEAGGGGEGHARPSTIRPLHHAAHGPPPPSPATGEEPIGPIGSFLQPGSAQLAAGLIIYGPQLTLVLSLGQGTHTFVYSESAGDYRRIAADMRIPPQAKEFAINASNYRHWDDSVRLYFDDCVKGVHGPRERDYNMRWLASLVVEAYRILVRGGVFLYPADKRPGYGNGRLRLVYEANPVAFLMDQAGGAATNGVQPILSLTPESLHQRTPLVFGSGREVAKLTGYHTDPSALVERSPLFGRRGLFRN